MATPNTTKDISGQTFGRLLVVRRSGSNRHRAAMWECLCECGSIVVANGGGLRSGNTASCGCGNRIEHTIHGMSRTSEYSAWRSMKQRCINPRHKAFALYGGRGINVCDRWLESFDNFFADMGPKPSASHSLERANNDGDYEPSNCLWATKIVQSRNRRNVLMVTIHGATKSLVEFATERGLNVAKVKRRVERGWSIERALS